MGCCHTEECPLFPLLNASLRGWRDYYCDTADGWRGCARYKLSLTGRTVPITVLPNGANAQHFRGIPKVDRSIAPEPRRTPRPMPDAGQQQYPHQPQQYVQQHPQQQQYQQHPNQQHPNQQHPNQQHYQQQADHQQYQQYPHQPQQQYAHQPQQQYAQQPAPARFEPRPTPVRRPTPVQRPAPQPLPVPVSQYPGNPPAQSPHPAQRRWWTRFSDWITGPA